MIHKKLLLTTVTCCLFMTPLWVSADEATNLLSMIERLAAAGDKAESSLAETVASGIKRHPGGLSAQLLSGLTNTKLIDKQLAVYVWALGLTEDESTVKAIEDLHQRSKSELVRGNCLRALAIIGGQQSGSFLLSVLDATPDKEKRFDILNLLGQMHCEAALPKTEEVLKEDPKEYYWQPIFVFGKMGDKAVPFLLTKINHRNRNIRSNAINVLGQWLIPPEAAKPLQDQFWAENDKELRGMILSSLERTIVDSALRKTVFEQVVAKEKDPALVKYAQETLGSLDEMSASVATFARKKKPSVANFQREYELLFESAGKKGSYEVLGVSSTISDETKLKSLRERILQRDSDEAFYDYQKVNKIIMQNRWMGTKR